MAERRLRPRTERYRSRISGSLLDRIDIHLEVPAVAYGEIVGEQSGETSAVIRARVEQARAVQRDRFRDQPGVHANAHMSTRELRRHCRLSQPVEAMLRQAGHNRPRCPSENRCDQSARMSQNGP